MQEIHKGPFTIHFKDKIKTSPSFIDAIEMLDQSFFPWPWKEGEIISHLLKESSFFSCVLAQEKLVGLVVGEIYADLSQFHLYKILIHPKFRGNGIGHDLFGASLSKLKSMGIGEIYLEVESENHAAIKLYEDFALEIIHQKKRFYSDGSDASIMLGSI